jgi:cytoskeletal protein RodZ
MPITQAMTFTLKQDSWYEIKDDKGKKTGEIHLEILFV